jgi:hypothetical protein
MNEMDYFDWRDYGISKGWISEPNCYTHDGVAMTEEEEAEFNEGGDPCIPMFRIWEENIGR